MKPPTLEGGAATGASLPLKSVPGLEFHEQEDERDNQTEKTRRFGECEAEEQVRELARSRRRIAKRALQEVAEDEADADTGADKGRAGEASADELCCCWIHDVFSCS